MNFFDAQDRARRTTRWLVVVYLIATALIVLGVTLIVGFALFGTSMDGYRFSLSEMLAVNRGPMIIAAAATTLFIVGASIYKTSRLSAGGGRVAQDLGGTLVPANVQDSLRRRLRNVVEEMAIASGVPVPEIYVLEEESGINAFAAGYTPGDAAIAVTRGALELLERDELQGVIAHEFSHVLNGDMRLNIRLMGVLFGILVLGLMGRTVVRGGYHARLMTGRRERGTPVVLLIGLGLAILGAIGVFFARMIKAGVSRQREYLADASAVQFTRQTDGIAGALKKIGGYRQASYLEVADPEEISHMLFGSGATFTGLFATHPPLGDRIRALDPSFRESDYPDVEPRTPTDTMAGDSIPAMAPATMRPDTGADRSATPDSLLASAGRPRAGHVAFAQQLRRSMPDSLYDAAHSAELALLLVIALVIDRSGRASERQLALAGEQLGAGRAGVVRRLYGDLRSIDPAYRLPLLEIAFPALKLRPRAQLGYLLDLAARMIDIDGKVDLHEYCFYRVLLTNLGQAVDPPGRRGPQRTSRRELRRSAIELITVVAASGHDDRAAGERAFEAGRALFGKWAREHTYSPGESPSLRELDRSLDALAALKGKSRQALVEAVTTVVMHDSRLTVAETELIRAICASLDVPLPPVLRAADAVTGR